MPNYKYKAEILNSNLYKEYKEINKAIYNFNYDANVPTKYSYEQALEKEYELFQDNYLAYRECYRLDHAFIQKKKRLRKRIETMIHSGECLFLTLTFSDDSLKHPYDKLKRYVREFLKSVADVYIANEDYGKENGRLHFHAIIKADRIDLDLWKYGFIFAQHINNLNAESLAKYITKLTNHAIKNTNRRSVMIYSRRIE